MTPSEVGKRFTAKDVGMILAYEEIQREQREEAEKIARLESKAQSMRGSL